MNTQQSPHLHLHGSVTPNNHAMARRTPTTTEQFQADEAAFYKLTDKFEGYKASIDMPVPTEGNIETAAKFAIRLVDH